VICYGFCFSSVSISTNAPEKEVVERAFLRSDVTSSHVFIFSIGNWTPHLHQTIFISFVSYGRIIANPHFLHDTLT